MHKENTGSGGEAATLRFSLDVEMYIGDLSDDENETFTRSRLYFTPT